MSDQPLPLPADPRERRELLTALEQLREIHGALGIILKYYPQRLGEHFPEAMDPIGHALARLDRGD